MRLAAFAVFLAMLALAGCRRGVDNAPIPGADITQDASLKAAAKVAERNLLKMRDGVLTYFKKNMHAPESIDELEPFGAGCSSLEASDDYADLGYSFYSLDFNIDGSMKVGWFIAAPKADRKALRVRMNGVTGDFDYSDPEKPLQRAPSDKH